MMEYCVKNDALIVHDFTALPAYLIVICKVTRTNSSIPTNSIRNIIADLNIETYERWLIRRETLYIATNCRIESWKDSRGKHAQPQNLTEDMFDIF